MPVLGITWVTEAERLSRCPACHVDGRNRHLLDTTLSPDNHATNTQSIALLQCGNCGARFADPVVAVDYQDADQEGMRYYVEQGAGIDVMLEVLSLLDQRPVKRYLEVGCSFGFAMEYARRALGWEVLGFDPGFVAAAGKRMLGLPIESRALEKGTVPQGAFDVVFCSEVIEHIPEPDGFIEILRYALSDDGVLLMTTPDGDAVTPYQPSELLMPVLSPGQHVILYNVTAIEALLRRHGFAHVRTRKNATQLQIVAAMTPLGEPAAYFTRARYREFLQDEFDAHRDDRYLTACIGYRLLYERVGFGAYADARATYQRLRDAYLADFGYDIEATNAVPIPAPAGLSLSAFGERLPFNLCGVWYCRGVIEFLDNGDPAAAADYFAAAMWVGGALRAILNAMGTDDVSLAIFCREAEIARLAALARCDPQEGLQTLRALQQRTLQSPSPEASLLRARAERQFFTDLVNLGHYKLAEELAADCGPLVDEPIAPGAVPTAMAYGIFLLNHRRDAPAARRILAQTRDLVLAEGVCRPGGVLEAIEIALLAAAALVGRAEARALIEDIALNRGGLAADAFAAHLQQVRRSAAQLFADLGYEA
jgi:2-polyprenyl-3-methyl-5-hydroxy-6-metoxy-1,4-benzoquinol methylase